MRVCFGIAIIILAMSAGDLISRVAPAQAVEMAPSFTLDMMLRGTLYHFACNSTKDSVACAERPH